MNRKVLLGIGAVILIIIVFLYYSLQKVPDSLLVVPNSQISTPIRPKVLYKLSYNALTPWSNSPLVVPTNATTLTPLDYTGKILPEPPTGVTGVVGGVNKLNIYNAGPGTMSIAGIDLKATGDATHQKPTSKIIVTIGLATGTPLTYDGSRVTIKPDNQIQFSNLNQFIIQRLTIMCDNGNDARSLYIYFINGSNQYSGIRINNLSNHILVIDMFANTIT